MRHHLNELAAAAEKFEAVHLKRERLPVVPLLSPPSQTICVLCWQPFDWHDVHQHTNWLGCVTASIDLTRPHGEWSRVTAVSELA
jgi:hypothetical protein